MIIDEEQYFGFTIPAIIAMIMGMELPLFSKHARFNLITSSFRNTSQFLKGKGIVGIALLSIGLSASVISVFLPPEFEYIGYLFSKVLFVGIFYIHNSEIQNKKVYLFLGFTVLISQSLIQGMFGELVYTLILGFLLILLGRNISLNKKYFSAIIGIIFVLLIQSVKSEYRDVAWNDGNVIKKQQTSLEFFSSLLLEKITNPSQFFNKDDLYPFVIRFNQGMLQARVMDYVPQYQPYENGKTIYLSIISSFVPRILWPDKPIAGGRWNMEHFTGLIIEGYSMNIGPLGEAYGNFGPEGGVYFMFFYGLFFNIVIYLLLIAIKKRPTIILWFPILFLNAIQVETDILMTVNSTLKNILFMAFCFWAADRFLRTKL
jgi:hypothetical protein